MTGRAGGRGGLLGAALDKAHEKARDAVEQHARLAGRDLVAVLSIREDAEQGQPGRYPMTAVDEARSSVPIEAGATEVSASVDVRLAPR